MECKIASLNLNTNIIWNIWKAVYKSLLKMGLQPNYNSIFTVNIWVEIKSDCGIETKKKKPKKD